MTEPAASFVAGLIASRGDDASSRARLDASQARAAACESWLKAFVHRPQTYETGAVADKPLAGLPFGVKDLMATHDMPTTYGSPIYADYRPTEDAWIVERIRHYGGIVFGKTVTTEFAWREPGPTVNPWNRLHTPGGSSSGSAASVGAGIVPVAVGTQTVGSVIRPAAFCGVVGYKPSYGKLATTGVHPLAPSLDHVGFFAQSVDLAALCHALFVDAKPEAIASTQAWSNYFGAKRPRKLGVVRTPFWDRVTDDQKDNFEATLAQLEADGVTLIDLDPLDALPGMIDALHTILQVEADRVIGPAAAQHPDKISRHMAVLTAAGREMAPGKYDDAIALQTRLRSAFGEMLEGCEAIVTVPATGGAPEGLLDTGDATFCAPWSFLGVPAVTVPSGKSKNGMPLGFQVIGRHGDDLPVLQTAAWIEHVLK
ncbi:amidase [Paraburkholderia sp.]|uniref:amidase n=1 Tax=Paraburkholderia sp. TaxID=1926495 RepID=UPI00238D1B3A|nr:amidase [Paraburkholderia sp.]MDE1182181.1 amidase [Paraburkholderia sp.]